MSDKNFDTDQSVQDAFRAIRNPSSEAEFAAWMATASKFKPDQRAYLADKIEKVILPEVKAKLSPDAIKVSREVAAVIEERRQKAPSEMIGSKLLDALDGVARISEIVKFVSKNKGAASDAFVKAYAEEAGKLSDEQSARPENLIKLICNAAEKSQGLKLPTPKTQLSGQKLKPLGM
jgi:hypothetical protein